jgi:glycosyltransferase involved in cell wall biosynthesis
MAWLHFEDEGTVAPYLEAQARAASCVTTVSEFSADEIRRTWQVRDVRVIYNGVDAAVARVAAASSQDLARLGVRGPFFLVTGGATRRKNLALLAEVWKQVHAVLPDHQLVLCGPRDHRRSLLFGALPRVVILNFLERSELLSVLAAAEALLLPSTYEGFGLPALEAMALGTPVIATPLGALPEITGRAAILVPPDPNKWASALAGAASDSTLLAELGQAGRLRAAAFSWDAAAAEYLALYREVAA